MLLVHPAVAQRFYRSWLLAKQDTPYVIKEAAILFENGGSKLCDQDYPNVLAPEAVRVQRVMAPRQQCSNEAMFRNECRNSGVMLKRNPLQIT